MDDEPVIDAVGLRKVFGRGARRVTALEGLDFRLERGECLALLGANGSGKSTTLKLVLGAIAATGGRALVFGGPAGARAARARTGYVPEEARRFGRLSGLETVDLFARLQGVGPRALRRSRVPAALEDVGLERRAWKQRVSGYSRGMARRLALATAWVHRPALLVLDEPTSGLDPIGSEAVLAVLARHHEGGGAALLSTHDRDAAERAAAQVLVLHAGRLALSGPPAAVFAGDDSASLLPLIQRVAADA